jgi:hypothetical protein
MTQVLADLVDPAVRVGAVAVLDAHDSSRSLSVTGPGVPSPMTDPPLADLNVPTGVITAAVPQAKTSVSSPAAQLACHASAAILPSSTW